MNFSLLKRENLHIIKKQIPQTEVYVAKDDKRVYENLKNADDKSMYNKVKMSDKEIQKKMDKNGYKKVVKEETVEKREQKVFTTDAEGAYRMVSQDSYTSKVLNRDFKYIDKSMKLANTTTEFLTNARPRKFENHILTEYPVFNNTYTYGERGSISVNNSAVMFAVQMLLDLAQIK